MSLVYFHRLCCAFTGKTIEVFPNASSRELLRRFHKFQTHELAIIGR